MSRSAWRSGSLFAAAAFYCFSSAAQLDDIVRKWEADPDLKGAGIAYCVAEARTGSVVSSLNAGRLLVPGSTLKIFTTACALATLKPEYRFSTRLSLSRNAQVKSGVLKGDLVITGGGDPSLGSKHFAQNGPFDEWVAALKARGIHKIEGNIVADGSLYERVIPDHWIWADVSNYFGAVPGGLNYADNLFTIVLKSGAPGSKVSIASVKPAAVAARMSLTCEVVAGGRSDEAYVYGDPFGYRRFIRGTIPPGRSSFEIEAAAPEPDWMCAESFRDHLEDAGIAVSGPAVRTAANDSLQNIDTFRSPSLDKLVAATNRYSINLYAEAMVSAMGKDGKGLDAIRNFWKTHGIEPTALFMADGCGLSRANTVTAGALCKALCVIAADSVLFRVIAESLPVAGQPGGLSLIGPGTRIQGNLRAKSGYIERVRSYAGYVTTGTGRLLSFAVIFNNYTCSPTEAREKMTKFMIALERL